VNIACSGHIRNPVIIIATFYHFANKKTRNFTYYFSYNATVFAERRLIWQHWIITKSVSHQNLHFLKKEISTFYGYLPFVPAKLQIL